jgi:prepilin-type N-terminal cleavage/methylation domain-containing protein
MRHLRAAGGRLGAGGRRGGFTLIELLAVMAIILILAGLILSIAGNANYKGAQTRAQGEIQAISTACESYKTDNGVYPRVTTTQASGTSATTDTLDARTNFDPNSGSPSYSSTSTTLYQLLSGFYAFNSSGTLAYVTPGTTPQPTAYYTFTDSQLANTGSLTSGYIVPTTVTAINDPFGYSYGYSTIYQADIDANNAATPPVTTPPTNGYNPTFDLWSTAGYSPSAGKSYPTNITSANYNTLWVKNW